MVERGFKCRDTAEEGLKEEKGLGLGLGLGLLVVLLLVLGLEVRRWRLEEMGSNDLKKGI